MRSKISSKLIFVSCVRYILVFFKRVYTTGRPGGVSEVILELGIGQFRELGASLSAYFTSRSWGLFSCAHIDLRKAPDGELATLDGKSTSSGIAEPYARFKLEGKNRGGRRDDTSATTACPEPGR